MFFCGMCALPAELLQGRGAPESSQGGQLHLLALDLGEPRCMRQARFVWALRSAQLALLLLGSLMHTRIRVRRRQGTRMQQD